MFTATIKSVHSRNATGKQKGLFFSRRKIRLRLCFPLKITAESINMARIKFAAIRISRTIVGKGMINTKTSTTGAIRRIVQRELPLLSFTGSSVFMTYI
jgi:hypothetical protein